jgi:hypothetical protein
MITRIVSIAFVLVFGFTARSQVSSTELSYFPHSIGDTWTYKVSVDNGVSGPVFSHYRTITVDRDTIFATGKRYYHFWSQWTRIDSLDGRVYVFDGNYGGCPDPYEKEVMNVTVDTSQDYTACQSLFDRWEVTSSDARAGLLHVTRHQRTWGTYTGWFVYAQGIGISYSATTGTGGRIIRELVHAVIGGQTYWPVEYRSIEASPIDENHVQLRWVTINEVNNAGFHIERRIDGKEEWKTIGFVPSRPEGDGEYIYRDAVAFALLPTARIEYRLVQQDYDGTLSYSPTISVDANPAIADRPVLRVFPNPATDHATIFWNTRSESPVMVTITDLLGRVIWNAAIPAHSNRITWNCRRSDGTAVSPGIYLAGVRDGATSTFVRMIVTP